MKTLLNLRKALIRLFPGKENAYKRMTIRRTAEHEAEVLNPDWQSAVIVYGQITYYHDPDGQSAVIVYGQITYYHAKLLTLGQGREIFAALERDLA